MTKRITRSTVNEEQYSAPQFPTSGFPLSYRRYSSYMLGRIHVGGFHWCMAGDKISGQTRGKCTFERIVTQLVSPVNAMQYNVFLPLRPLDRTFKKGTTPTKMNAMSANWKMPTVNTRHLVDQILRLYFGSNATGSIVTLHQTFISLLTFSPTTKTLQGLYSEFFNTPPAPYANVSEMLYGSSSQEGLVSQVVKALTDANSRLVAQAKDLYLQDALLDIVESINAKLGTSDHPLSGAMSLASFRRLYLETILTPFVGRYSYYAEFKYQYLRPLDFYRIANGLIKSPSYGVYSSFLQMFSDTPQNEYALRAIYAIWYELFRNVDLEPVSTTLPDWQEFGSTSIFDASSGNMCFLLLRIRNWEKDMFITAQIDDISRHVYAPIYNYAGSSKVTYDRQPQNNLDANPDGTNLISASPKPSIFKLGYRDQLSETNVTIDCPVPSNVNDVLSHLETSFQNVYGLDLNTLRQSQMLEKYLKRNYLFGDEYQDRILAHYNSRVSDFRVNKPEVLSQSMNGYEMGQQVSNVSTDFTAVGERTATAEIKVDGTPYTTYCEEFGIMVSLVCFMPRAMYDGICPQNLLANAIDLPLPEFATNNEEFGRKCEIADSGLNTGYVDAAQDTRYIFGRYPAYHAWRSRVDEVGGKFLDEMQDCTFRRFWGMYSDDTTPKLNYFFLHCRPNLGMFANTVRFDSQLYGDLVHECFVERVLPTPVEVI